MSGDLMRNYIEILERNQFEANIHAIFERSVKKSFDKSMLTEDLLNEKIFTAANVLRTTFIGLIEIVRILFKSGWYVATRPIKSLIAAAAASTAHAIHPFVQKMYIAYQYAQQKIQAGIDVFQGLPNLPAVNTSWRNAWGARPEWLGGKDTVYNKLIAMYENMQPIMDWLQSVVKEADNVFFNENMTPEQTAELLKAMGISDSPYTDALMAAFSYASAHAIDHFFVVLAISLPFVYAAVFKDAGDKVDTLLKSKSQQLKNKILGNEQPQELSPPDAPDKPKLSDPDTIDVQAKEK